MCFEDRCEKGADGKERREKMRERKFASNLALMAVQTGPRGLTGDKKKSRRIDKKVGDHSTPDHRGQATWPFTGDLVGQPGH